MAPACAMARVAFDCAHGELPRPNLPAKVLKSLIFSIILIYGRFKDAGEIG